MKKLMSIFLFIVSISVMNGCKKDDPEETQDPVINTGSEVDATISGRVLDESNNPIAGATVTAYTLTATTDQYGIFLMEGSINKNRCVMNISKTGYQNRVHAFIPKSDQVNYVKVILAAEAMTQYVASATGGTVTTVGGGSVQLPSNSIVIGGSTTQYNGVVSIKASLLSTSNANFTAMIPGGDLAGTDAGGDDVSLYSYGMMNVVMQGSGGEPLQLASGSTATIKLPIAAAQLANAPATIPLWYLDETDGIWKEEGVATKVGNNYVGTVSHFSWWNYDIGYGRGTIKGRVVDCEGTPLANVTVTVNSQMTVVTDQDGYYTNWVPAGMALTFRVLPQGVITLPSQLENVAPLTDGQTVTVPDLEVPCGARIYGIITDCDGEPIAGTVMLLENNSWSNSIHTSTGSFSIMAEENVTYTLASVASSGVNSFSITSPSGGDSLDAGTIQICSSTTYDQGFTITGNGYAGEEVTLLTTITPGEAYWFPATSSTFGEFNGGSSEGLCPIYFTYQGNSTGIKNLSLNPNSGSFQITLNGYTYYASSPSANPFLLELTHYGPVGDSIKGTFSGAMRYFGGGASEVIITNGRFAFPRTPDH